LVLSVFGSGLFGSNEEPPFKVITTVFPLKDFAAAVSGNRADVRQLMPPGAEIHSWQPRPGDIVRLSSADVFLYIGLDLEPWVPGIIESVGSPRLKVFSACQAVGLTAEGQAHSHHGEHAGHSEEEGIDPHIWLDFDLDMKIIDAIVSLFSSIKPEQGPYFRANAEDYKKRLQALDSRYRTGLEKCAHRKLILGGHAAFGYLADRYDLEQISLYGLNPDSKPTPKQLIEVVELARKEGTRVIFFEEQLSGELAEVIAKEIGARTLVLNAGASLSRDELRDGRTFIKIMEKNLEHLRDGLACHR